jgi:hypothetical protein
MYTMDHYPKTHRVQAGAVLVIALIMLLVSTLIAVATFEMGSNNFLVVANLESQRQAQRVAEAKLEEAISDWDTFESSLMTPNVGVFWCQGRKNHECVDLNEDAIADIEIYLGDPNPFCTRVEPIKNNDLNLNDPDDPDAQGCFIGTPQSGAVDGAGSGGMSMCSDAVWDIHMNVKDLPWSDSKPSRVTVRQGVGVRVSNNSIPPECR